MGICLSTPRNHQHHHRRLQTHPYTSIPVDDIVQSAILSQLAYETPEGLRAAAALRVDTVAGLRQDLRDSISDTNPVFVDGNAAVAAAAAAAAGQKDAQAYVWHVPEHDLVMVVFRGTSSSCDAASNLDVRMRSDEANPGVRVHRGFFDQFKSVESQILQVLEHVPFKAIHVVGHSLGGACATIAAVHLKRAYPDATVRCTTFGSPRVGNAMFAWHFARSVDESYRVHNHQDPVSMVPASHRFEHVGGGLCFDDAGMLYMVACDLPWWRRLSACAATIDYGNPVEDHSCELYVQRCAALTDVKLLKQCLQVVF
jgi:hypothetical protein